MIVGGVGDEAELIADAIARRNTGQGRPLNTMLLAVLVSLLLERQRQGQALPAPHYLRKYVDDDIRQVFFSHEYQHEAADDDDPEWQQASDEMKAAGFLPSEIQHAQAKWGPVDAGVRLTPSPSTISRYLGAALEIVQSL